MAFNAGSIEATLTLNRNPFTAGLAAARQQAQSFANNKYEAEIGIKVDQRQLLQAEAALKRFAQRVSANAGVVVDRVAFDRLVRDLRDFGRSRYTSNLDLDTGAANGALTAFEARMRSLRDETVRLNVNTREFGDGASGAFDRASGSASHFEKILLAISYGLPVLGSAIVAAGGGLGAIASWLVILAGGIGAFAAVAVPVFKDMQKAVEGGAAEIAKLPPGVREAADAFVVLKGAADQLVQSNQRVVGIALAAWFDAGTAALRTLNPLVNASAIAIGAAGEKFEAFFNAPWWRNFVQFLSGAMGPAMDLLSRSLIALIQIIGNLTRAFWDFGGSEIMGMIVSGLEQFATWTERLGQNTTFLAFMDAAKTSLPIVGRAIAEVTEFVIKLAIGLAPIGDLFLEVLTIIFEAINKLDPAWLATITLAMLAFWASITFGLGPAVGLVVAALVALSVGMRELYVNSEEFRGGVNALGTEIMSVLRPAFEWLRDFVTGTIVPALGQFAGYVRDNVIPAIQEWYTQIRDYLAPIWDTIVTNWNTKILPALQSLWERIQNSLIPAVKDLWNELTILAGKIRDEVGPELPKLVDTITGKLIPGFILAVEGVVQLITWFTQFVTFLVEVFGPTIAEEFGSAVTVIDGALKTIGGLLQTFGAIFTGDWQAFHDGLKLIAEGFWTIVAGMWGLNLDELKAKFQAWDAEWSKNWSDAYEAWKQAPTDFWTWFTDGWARVFEQSLTGQNTYQQQQTDSWNAHYPALQAIVEGFWTWFTDGWTRVFQQSGTEMQTWWTGVTETWNAGITNAQGILEGFWTWFIEGWTRIFQQSLTEIQTWWTSVGETWNQGIANIQSIFEPFITWFTEGWARLFTQANAEVQAGMESIRGFIDSAIQTIQGVIEGFITWFTDGWARLFQQANAEVQGGMQTIQQTIDGALQAIRGFFESIGSGIMAAWNSLWSSVEQRVNQASQIISQAVDGIRNAWNTVMGWIGGGTVAAQGGEVQVFAKGGPVRSSSGAKIPSYPTGGRIFGPGTGTSDSIVARVSNGEYIIPARVSKQILPFLSALRVGEASAFGIAKMFGRRAKAFELPGFASGGSVSTVNNGNGTQTTTTITWMDMWTKFGAAATSLFNSIVGSLPAFPPGQIGQSASQAPPNMVARALQGVQRIFSSIVETITSWVTSAIPLLADDGAKLPPGRSIVDNKSGQMENILTNRQLSALERNANKFGNDGDIEKLVRAIVQEVQPMYGAIHVTTTPQASASDIIGEVAFRARLARRKGAHV